MIKATYKRRPSWACGCRGLRGYYGWEGWPWQQVAGTAAELSFLFRSRRQRDSVLGMVGGLEPQAVTSNTPPPTGPHLPIHPNSQQLGTNYLNIWAPGGYFQSNHQFLLAFLEIYLEELIIEIDLCTWLLTTMLYEERLRTKDVLVLITFLLLWWNIMTKAT